MRFLIVVTMVLFLAQCKQAKPKEKELSVEHDIVGTWYSEKMDYTLDYLTDSAKNEIVSVDQYPELYQMSGVKAIYKADSSFTSSYLGLDGQAMQTDTGMWYGQGDSLFIIYFSEDHGDTLKYAYEMEENRGKFQTIIDWDQDGFIDDLLILESRREK